MATSIRDLEQKTKYSQVYVGGTVVRPLVPDVAPPVPRTKLVPDVRRATKANRAKAAQMNLAYVLFLTLTAVATLFLCVHFVQLKSQLTTQMENVAHLESELSVLKADNDAFYNSVAASVDLEYIKSVATNELGMEYPSEDQIIYFDTAGDSYVRQYQDVPEVK